MDPALQDPERAEYFCTECDHALEAEGTLLAAYRQVVDALQKQKRMEAASARRRLEDQRQSWGDAAYTGNPLSAGTSTGSSLGLEVAVNRRDLLTSTVGIVAGVASSASNLRDIPFDLAQQLDLFTAISIQIGRQGLIGQADLVRLNAIHDLYQSLDHQYGGGLVYQSMYQVADAAVALLYGSYPNRMRLDLFAAVANLRILASWSVFDMCDHTTGQRHFAAA